MLCGDINEEIKADGVNIEYDFEKEEKIWDA